MATLSDFDFELPADRIAQRPAARRGSSRLMVLDRDDGSVAHRRFPDLAAYLRPGDLLVLNDTRVFPARLIGHKDSGGRVEILLTERVAQDGCQETWRCLMRASRRPAAGTRVDLGGGLSAEILPDDGGDPRVRLSAAGAAPADLVGRRGQLPLPPYIERPAGPDGEDDERYQTVYARRPGAVAAPTAGLHFTTELLGTLEAAGVRTCHLTLHVGPGTFQPVRSERVEDHRMHEERFDVPATVEREIDATRERGGRVVAVGTTVVRALESCASADGRISARSGRCSLFIHPGFRFRVIDVLLTNFHLPRSSLLMLVSAFAGREHVLAAYRQAVEAEYRFYSYGDAMLVVGK